MKDKVTDIIKNVVKDYAEQTQNSRLNNPKPDMVLYGKGSAVDSIGLVSIIVSTELQLEESFGETLTLADEKAMSQRNSPFRTIDTMAAYIVSVMGNNAHE